MTDDDARPGVAATMTADDVLTAFEQAPTVLVAQEGPEFHIVAANAAARVVLGDRDPLLGVPAVVAMPELSGQRLIELMERVYDTGRAEAAHEWRVQIDQDRDGRLEDHWYSFVVSPWQWPDGSRRGVLSHIVEVTDHVRGRLAAEEEAQLAEQRYRAAHDVATDLQRALLPQGLPVLPGLRLDARYLVAGDEQAAGGDWFDAIALDDGRVALVVGDVVGHGTAASTVMGQLRAVLRHLIDTGVDLEGILEHLDTFAARNRSAVGTTVCLAVLDPVTGALRSVSCGHPPPLVVDGTGATRFLPTSGGHPLGARPAGAERTTDPGPAPGSRVTEAVLAPGELLVLYTDGLVERAGRTLTDGLTELALVAGGAAAGTLLGEGAAAEAADRVAGLTVEVLTRNGWSDDVTVLVAHRRPKPVPVLRASLPATAASLRRLRLLVDEWSAGLDLAPDLRRALQVAAGEALTNSIEHAYPRGGAPGGDTGAVEITGRLSQRGDLHVTVADAGTWRRPEPGPSLRGRGLAIMSRLMDRLQVTDDAGGTTVELTLRAARPVVVAVPGQSPTSPLPTPPDPAADFSVEVQAPPDGGDATVVRVRGPVDAATVTRLEAALRTATRGGVLPVAVDLSEVTLLSSVGVRALMGVRGQVTAHGQRLRIVAPPRSMARDALDLVGVDVDDVALTHP